MGEDQRPGAAAARPQLHAETDVLAERSKCLVLKGKNILLKLSFVLINFLQARPQALKLSVLTGAHSPDKFRVQGTFSNMAAFSRDWGCPLGSNMNPAQEDKYKVW